MPTIHITYMMRIQSSIHRSQSRCSSRVLPSQLSMRVVQQVRLPQVMQRGIMQARNAQPKPKTARQLRAYQKTQKRQS